MCRKTFYTTVRFQICGTSLEKNPVWVWRLGVHILWPQCICYCITNIVIFVIVILFFYLRDWGPTSSYMNWSVRADLPTPPLPTIITLWRAKEFGVLGLFAAIIPKKGVKQAGGGVYSAYSVQARESEKRKKHRLTVMRLVCHAQQRSQWLQCIMGTRWRAAPDVTGTEQ